MESVANVVHNDSETEIADQTLAVEEQIPVAGEEIRTVVSSVPHHFEDMEREPANGPASSLERTTTPTTPNTSPVKHITHRDSSWLEIDVCREFVRGECNRSAEECKFAHPTGSVVIKEGNKVTCCFDFLKDRCTRETCKYLHPSNAVKEKLVMAGKQYGQVMAQSTTKPLIASPLSPAMQPLPVGGAFFSPYMTSPLPTNSMTNASTGYSLPYYSLRMEVCETFDQGYSCAKGEHCLFSHPEAYVRINNDNTVTVCWNYLNGYCRHHNCWFYHPSPMQLLAYQLPSRSAIPQPGALDSMFLTPYPSPTDTKLTTSLQPQLSPTLAYPFVFQPQVMPVSSSFPPSPTTQFTSSSSLPQTIVS